MWLRSSQLVYIKAGKLRKLHLHAATCLPSVFMSVADRNVEYITTVWGKAFNIDRDVYTHYASFVHAVCESKALVLEACEETGGLAEDDVDDTRKAIDKAVDKGICCTDIHKKTKREDTLV